MSPIYLKMPGKGDDIATVLSKIILGSLIVKGLAKCPISNINLSGRCFLLFIAK